jgi:hypothetical protein
MMAAALAAASLYFLDTAREPIAVGMSPMRFG